MEIVTNVSDKAKNVAKDNAGDAKDCDNPDDGNSSHLDNNSTNADHDSSLQLDVDQ